MKKTGTYIATALLSLSLLAGPLTFNSARAATLPQNIDAQKSSQGRYFIDDYKNNLKTNTTPATNPVMDVLSPFTELWTPGSAWNNGVQKNSAVLNANIQKVIDISKTRTKAEETAAYLDDRRNQSYSVIEGLGALTDVYRRDAGATTTITDVAADATSVKYDDKGTGYGDKNAKLGNIVNLVATLRGDYSSGNPAKAYFKYARPFRWDGNAVTTNTNSNKVVIPTLIPALNADPNEDGGFPSGHTNAAYLTAYAMGYAVPQRFQELLTRASELGNNRIIAGMHSPLDVMGGRVMATALAAAILNDPANKAIKEAAYNTAQNVLLKENGHAEDRFSDYAANKALYTQRLTYGFSQIGSAAKPAVVPKGAEVLIETRFPYLNSDQRRWVLATTALSSGYPLLDDAEGWGRLNLFAAADGYGALVNDVTVTMNADKGGFNAEDTWRNAISGDGKLTKKGTGTLKLAGSNTYKGGTELDEGRIEADQQNALGAGSVTNNGGTLSEQVSGKVAVNGTYTQAGKGVLVLNIGSAQDVMEISGTADFAGTLQLNFTNNYKPAAGTELIKYKDLKNKFAAIKVTGLSGADKNDFVYAQDALRYDPAKSDATGTNTTGDQNKNGTATDKNQNNSSDKTAADNNKAAKTSANGNKATTNKLPTTGDMIEWTAVLLGIALTLAGIIMYMKKRKQNLHRAQ